MNIWLWISIIGISVSLVVALMVMNSPKWVRSSVYRVRAQMSMMSMFVLFFVIPFGIGLDRNDQKVRDEQKVELQTMGFRVLVADGQDRFYVGLPDKPIGCRLLLLKQDRFWLIELPKDFSRSVVNADEVARRPVIVKWCG